jgi:hypothetical protein
VAAAVAAAAAPSSAMAVMVAALLTLPLLTVDRGQTNSRRAVVSIAGTFTRPLRLGKKVDPLRRGPRTLPREHLSGRALLSVRTATQGAAGAFALQVHRSTRVHVRTYAPRFDAGSQV